MLTKLLVLLLIVELFTSLVYFAKSLNTASYAKYHGYLLASITWLLILVLTGMTGSALQSFGVI